LCDCCGFAIIDRSYNPYLILASKTETSQLTASLTPV
jgi:hypothetical protein